MIKSYIDFEVEFQPLTNDGYPFSVQSMRSGDARGVLPLLADETDYQALKKQLEALETDEDILVQIGQKLFDALFQGKVRDVYARTQGMLQEGEGIRLKLNVGSTEAAVAALPWEFLYDPDQGPLAMLDMSIVRYPQQSARIPNLAANLPLKVLLSAAQPKGADPVEVERELQTIREVLAEQDPEQQRIQIVEEKHLTRSRLQRLLRQGFHVWHFAGHGGFSPDGKTGRLYFEDASGDLEYVNSVELGILLRGSGVRLIVLDACEGARLGLATEPFRSMAPALIRNQIPAVVAMQFSVPDESTRAFAADFYSALAAGLPVDACVTEGRKAVMGVTGLGRPDWGIPVVYTRAPDGKLFDLPAAPAVQGGGSQVSQDAAGTDVNRAGDAPKQSGGTGTSATGTSGIDERAEERKRAEERAEEKKGLDELLKMKKARLHPLEMRAAMYGINAPPEVTIEIKDLRREIGELERQIQELGG